MTVITEERIDQVLRDALQGQGVLRDVKNIDVFLTPDGVLTEVLLGNASILEQVRRAIASAARQLESEGVWVLPTIRALWQIEDVERIEVPSPAGAPLELVGALFKGTLRSGTKSQEVWVAVTPAAQRVLRPLATNEQAWLELIRAYLAHRLSIGGASYWDPVREPQQELNEDAARYLRWRPYEALKSSIDDVFSGEESVERFARIMNHGSGTRNIRRFQDALMDLPTPGGAYSRGERLPTSNEEFYNMLLEPEKHQLESYYLDQVKKAEKDFPGLKNKFPAVFN